MQEEKVVLVDKFDNQLGLMPKMEAHKKGILHRAFSIFILNSNKELLENFNTKPRLISPKIAA